MMGRAKKQSKIKPVLEKRTMVPVMRLRVDISVYGGDSYDNDGDGHYNNSSYSNYFEGVSIGHPPYDEPIPFEVLEGDDVYVLWAEWSTGDSFSHSHNGSTEVIAIFKSYKKAKEAREAIENYKRPENIIDNWEAANLTHFINEIGEKQSFYIPWNGYFESLGGIHIDKVTVKPV